MYRGPWRQVPLVPLVPPKSLSTCPPKKIHHHWLVIGIKSLIKSTKGDILWHFGRKWQVVHSLMQKRGSQRPKNDLPLIFAPCWQTQQAKRGNGFSAMILLLIIVRESSMMVREYQLQRNCVVCALRQKHRLNYALLFSLFCPWPCVSSRH